MSSNQRSNDEGYELFDPSQKRDQPREGLGFMQVGAVAGLAGVGYMIRNFKNKNEGMKLSVYVIHTRMIAQCTVIGVLSLGMVHQMYTRFNKKNSA